MTKRYALFLSKCFFFGKFSKNIFPNHLGLHIQICQFAYLLRLLEPSDFKSKSHITNFYGSHLGCPQCVCVGVFVQSVMKKTKKANFVDDQCNTVLFLSQMALK